jgi:hypothetical protein
MSNACFCSCVGVSGSATFGWNAAAIAVEQCDESDNDNDNDSVDSVLNGCSISFEVVYAYTFDISRNLINLWK